MRYGCIKNIVFVLWTCKLVAIKFCFMTDARNALDLESHAKLQIELII